MRVRLPWTCRRAGARQRGGHPDRRSARNPRRADGPRRLGRSRWPSSAAALQGAPRGRLERPAGRLREAGFRRGHSRMARAVAGCGAFPSSWARHHRGGQACGVTDRSATSRQLGAPSSSSSKTHAPRRGRPQRGSLVRSATRLGNWKMHGGIARPASWPQPCATGSSARAAWRWRFCPPFTSLPTVAECCGFAYRFGRPELSLETRAPSRRDRAGHAGRAGLSFVILGQSARRSSFRETAEVSTERWRAVLRPRAGSIALRRETGEERRQGLTLPWSVSAARRTGPGRGRTRSPAPSWPTSPCGRSALVSTPRPPKPRKCNGYLRGIVSELASKETAQSLRILYGGSVKPDNAAALIQEPDIDGASWARFLPSARFHHHREEIRLQGGSSKE